jgi:hypothetical protein
MGFIDGNVLRLAIGGGGGAEDEFPDPRPEHRLQEDHGPGRVVDKKSLREGHGFAGLDIGREMHHRIHPPLAEDP